MLHNVQNKRNFRQRISRTASLLQKREVKISRRRLYTLTTRVLQKYDTFIIQYVF